MNIPDTFQIKVTQGDIDEAIQARDNDPDFRPSCGCIVFQAVVRTFPNTVPWVGLTSMYFDVGPSHSYRLSRNASRYTHERSVRWEKAIPGEVITFTRER